MEGKVLYKYIYRILNIDRYIEEFDIENTDFLFIYKFRRLDRKFRFECLRIEVKRRNLGNVFLL